MNWDGLKLTTELGYRVAPTRYANGDAYLFPLEPARCP